MQMSCFTTMCSLFEEDAGVPYPRKHVVMATTTVCLGIPSLLVKKSVVGIASTSSFFDS